MKQGWSQWYSLRDEDLSRGECIWPVEPSCKTGLQRAAVVLEYDGYVVGVGDGAVVGANGYTMWLLDPAKSSLERPLADPVVQ